MLTSAEKERNEATAHTDAEFHSKVLEIIKFISKNIGTDFYVNDTTCFADVASRT